MAETTRNIYQRMSEVQRAIGYVQKESKKVNNQYTFVSHDAVVGALRGPMIDNGIVYTVDVLDHTRDGNTTSATVAVTFINVDSPDDRFTVRGFGEGVDQQDKGPGKSISYAVKYILLKAFALETGDDPERDSIDAQPNGNGHNGSAKKTAPDPSSPPKGNSSKPAKSDGWQAVGSALETIFPAYEKQERFAVLHEYADWVNKGGSKKEVDALAAHCEAIAKPIAALRTLVKESNPDAPDKNIEARVTQLLAEMLEQTGRKSILNGEPAAIEAWVNELKSVNSVENEQ